MNCIANNLYLITANTTQLKCSNILLRYNMISTYTLNANYHFPATKKKKF